MAIFSVDTSRCRRDGACAAVCPVSIVDLPAGGGPPQVPREKALWCIRCGHCEAACPHGALSLDRPAGEAPALDEALRPAPEQAAQFLRSRRSVRRYRPDALPRDEIETILDVARYAPSGGNRQPVQWLVLHETARVRELARLTIEWVRGQTGSEQPALPPVYASYLLSAWERGEDPVCRGAPHLVVAFAHDEQRGAPVDCTIALSYLELAAHARGLGACWAGFVMMGLGGSEAVRQALGLPPRHRAHGAMMLGRPAERYYRIPKRNSAKVLWR